MIICRRKIFFVLIREHDLFDAWKEYLEIFQDRPPNYMVVR